MRYKGKVYRPPSEAYSLIVQVTYGCSHNRCAFCDMYDDKHFAMRPMDEIREDFELARRVYRRVERVFLADGDALMRKTADLVEILGLVYGLFPECERVTCYASPTSLQIKSEDDLRLLRSKGLQMVYMGLESGCDAVLEKMQKGHTAADIVAAGQKARRCGLALSVTAISGLGSVAHWREHAVDTARAVSEMKPDYLGLLTLMVEPGTPLEAWVREGSFTLLSPLEVLKETELFLQHVDSEGTVFRANHASNYLTLKGTLNGDRKALLAQIAAGRPAGPEAGVFAGAVAHTRIQKGFPQGSPFAVQPAPRSAEKGGLDRVGGFVYNRQDLYQKEDTGRYGYRQRRPSRELAGLPSVFCGISAPPDAGQTCFFAPLDQCGSQKQMTEKGAIDRVNDYIYHYYGGMPAAVRLFLGHGDGVLLGQCHAAENAGGKRQQPCRAGVPAAGAL